MWDKFGMATKSRLVMPELFAPGCYFTCWVDALRYSDNTFISVQADIITTICMVTKPEKLFNYLIINDFMLILHNC